MPQISLIINCDTRAEKQQEGGLLAGVVNLDFLTDGIFNKQCYLKGFDFETIVFIDKHNDIPQDALDYLYKICDTVVVRKHTEEEKFNDNNYISALSLARGEIVMHIDQDMSCFASSPKFIQDQIDLLENFDYISYPSHWTPRAHTAEEYDYMWCSTRYFICKRETLDFTEIKKCLFDSDYMYGKYPASIRNPWTEHVLGLVAKYTGKGVYYPPINMDEGLVFNWGRYEKFLLRRLNEQSYDTVKDWVESRGIQYPVDVFC